MPALTICAIYPEEQSPKDSIAAGKASIEQLRRSGKTKYMSKSQTKKGIALQTNIKSSKKGERKVMRSWLQSKMPTKDPQVKLIVAEQMRTFKVI
jgi:hypothetical protein